jgi:hypothetical protein
MVYDCAPEIALYRHCDGYPSVAGAAILEALDGATCPEQVAGKLLSMTYDSQRPMDRLRAIYHPTESAEAHGDLEYVYTIAPHELGWSVTVTERGDEWEAPLSAWPKQEYTAATFAAMVRAAQEDR